MAFSSPTTRNSYSAGHFELEIDGHQTTAFVKSIDGGWARGTVVDDPKASGPEHVKHISTVDIDPFSFEFGLTGANDVLNWIQGSWKRKPTRRNGQITHANFDLYQTYEHEFYDAMITETTIPTLDGSSKEGGYLKCKIQPERVVTTRKPGVGQRVSANMGMKMKQKLWTPAAFRFNIDRLDDMRFTNKIDSFTIKQGVRKFYVGAERFPQVEPTGIQFPNLTGTISLQYADKLLQWHHDYVYKGRQDRGAQKTGSLEFLSPDRKTTIFQINLFEVGLVFAAIENSSANQDQIKRVKFEMYVHRMELDGEGGLGFDDSNA
jgi:hypothetical protein